MDAAMTWTLRLPPAAFAGGSLSDLTPAWLKRVVNAELTEFYVSHLSPLWSMRQVKARVVDIVDESAGCKSFILQPNGLWRGFRPGQFVTVTVEIEGVRQQRCYSLSSDWREPERLRITVKEKKDGRVSSWLLRNLRKQDVLLLSQAQGEFTAPQSLSEPLLLIAAGSGITPLRAMLYQLEEHPRNTVLIYYARSREELIFAEEIRKAAAQCAHLTVHICYTAAGHNQAEEGGRFHPDQLSRWVPDYRDRRTLVCGPEGLMQRVRRHWREEGGEARISFEDFTGAFQDVFDPGLIAPSQSATCQVDFQRSACVIEADGRQSLLDLAEAAGLHPPFGCRMGICHSCKARKRAGVVRNLVTGKASSAGSEEIQLCICIPITDVSLDV
ncbi:Flavodoxin reductases (ferredoxin-NADPH reductases) family 1 [Hahella chejuensis KCTC 2396]|uniref:Flavodoxin reductases (Ferredoxin-NADPH reductases) family 1 n=2 Tax=Hahella chejuensis TaxID=158327 RepID=Q2SFK8_HAHCH|nr:Flavodoxin reductases (ferredoxin-NADPH reductases) family 1 [Hahella chejuensis KCTC 2396]